MRARRPAGVACIQVLGWLVANPLLGRHVRFGGPAAVGMDDFRTEETAMRHSLRRHGNSDIRCGRVIQSRIAGVY